MKIKIILIYIKAVLLKRKKIKGYVYKEIGNSPIVGNDFFKGYELINPKINKVVFRNVKNYGFISGGIHKKFTLIKAFFPKNII